MKGTEFESQTSFSRISLNRMIIAGSRRYLSGRREWVGLSPAGKHVSELLEIVAASRQPLLLYGECGVGKEYLARLIHANGPFPEAEFFPVKAEIIPFAKRPSSPEATLFSRCEWKQTPPELLPEAVGKEVARIICALNVSALKVAERGFAEVLEKIDSRCTQTVESSAVDAGVLRDVWLRLAGENALLMEVPPLRKRREDILFLAGHFLEEALFHQAGMGYPLAAETGSSAGVPALLPEAAAALLSYCWPGNCRELRLCMEYAAESLGEESVCGTVAAQVTLDNLPPEIKGFAAEQPSFARRLEELEAEMIRLELVRQNGNITRTARALGFTPRQTAWRMKKYGAGDC